MFVLSATLNSPQVGLLQTSSIVVGSISSNIGLLYRAGLYCTSPDFLIRYPKIIIESSNKFTGIVKLFFSVGNLRSELNQSTPN